jgi:hypothetical protein
MPRPEAFTNISRNLFTIDLADDTPVTGPVTDWKLPHSTKPSPGVELKFDRHFVLSPRVRRPNRLLKKTLLDVR